MSDVLPESRRVRRLRRSVVVVLPSDRPHGTRGLYVQGCRCDACTDAEADYSRERKRARRLSHTVDESVQRVHDLPMSMDRGGAMLDFETSFPNLDAFGSHRGEVERVLRLRFAAVLDDDGLRACCRAVSPEHASFCDEAASIAAWTPWPTEEPSPLLYGRDSRAEVARSWLALDVAGLVDA